jgi:transposase
MKAIPGGKAKPDKIDAHTLAVLRRGGRPPQAYVYPAERRATRDLLRRRTPLMRQRAELFSHVHKTNRQYNLPELGKNIADKANRQGGAERFTDPAVQQTMEVDLALIPYYANLLQDSERSIVKTAKPPEANTLYLLRTVPGIGTIRSLVRLDEIHDMDRLPRVQDFVASSPLVKCARESAGTRVGTAGKNIGNAHLKWAFSEAATLFLRHNPDGQKLLARRAKTHDTGKALTLLAHQRARAVSDLLKRQTAFDRAMFLRT